MGLPRTLDNKPLTFLQQNYHYNSSSGVAAEWFLSIQHEYDIRNENNLLHLMQIKFWYFIKQKYMKNSLRNEFENSQHRLFTFSKHSS